MLVILVTQVRVDTIEGAARFDVTFLSNTPCLLLLRHVLHGIFCYTSSHSTLLDVVPFCVYYRI